MCTCVFVLPCVIATIPRSFVPILDACGNSFPSAPGVRPRSSPSTHCLRTSPSPICFPASQHPSKIFLADFDFVVRWKKILCIFSRRETLLKREKRKVGVDVS